MSTETENPQMARWREARKLQISLERYIARLINKCPPANDKKTYEKIDDHIAKLRLQCMTIIFADFEFAHKHKVQTELWNTQVQAGKLYNAVIKDSRGQHVALRRIEKRYIAFLSLCQMFYEGYIHRLMAAYDMPILRSIGDQLKLPESDIPAVNPVELSPKMLNMVVSACHDALVALGDLARHHLKLKAKPALYDTAVSFYQMANTLGPRMAHGHHGIGLASVEVNKHFLVVYHLYRAMMATDPHPNATKNLETEFYSIKNSEVSLATKDPLPLQVLEIIFVRLHAYFYYAHERSKSANLPELENLFFRRLDEVLHKENFKPDDFKTLLQMTVVNLFASELAARKQAASSVYGKFHTQIISFTLRFGSYFARTIMRMYSMYNLPKGDPDPKKFSLSEDEDFDLDCACDVSMMILRVYICWFILNRSMILALSITLEAEVTNFLCEFARALTTLAEFFGIDRVYYTEICMKSPMYVPLLEDHREVALVEKGNMQVKVDDPSAASTPAPSFSQPRSTRKQAVCRLTCTLAVFHDCVKDQMFPMTCVSQDDDKLVFVVHDDELPMAADFIIDPALGTTAPVAYSHLSDDETMSTDMPDGVSYFNDTASNGSGPVSAPGASSTSFHRESVGKVSSEAALQAAMLSAQQMGIPLRGSDGDMAKLQAELQAMTNQTLEVADAIRQITSGSHPALVASMASAKGKGTKSTSKSSSTAQPATATKERPASKKAQKATPSTSASSSTQKKPVVPTTIKQKPVEPKTILSSKASSKAPAATEPTVSTPAVATSKENSTKKSTSKATSAGQSSNATPVLSIAKKPTAPVSIKQKSVETKVALAIKEPAKTPAVVQEAAAAYVPLVPKEPTPPPVLTHTSTVPKELPKLQELPVLQEPPQLLAVPQTIVPVKADAGPEPEPLLRVPSAAFTNITTSTDDDFEFAASATPVPAAKPEIPSPSQPVEPLPRVDYGLSTSIEPSVESRPLPEMAPEVEPLQASRAGPVLNSAPLTLQTMQSLSVGTEQPSAALQPPPGFPTSNIGGGVTSSAFGFAPALQAVQQPAQQSPNPDSSHRIPSFSWNSVYQPKPANSAWQQLTADQYYNGLNNHAMSMGASAQRHRGSVWGNDTLSGFFSSSDANQEQVRPPPGFNDRNNDAARDAWGSQGMTSAESQWYSAPQHQPQQQQKLVNSNVMFSNPFPAVTTTHDSYMPVYAESVQMQQPVQMRQSIQMQQPVQIQQPVQMRQTLQMQQPVQLQQSVQMKQPTQSSYMDQNSMNNPAVGYDGYGLYGGYGIDRQSSMGGQTGFGQFQNFQGAG